MLSPCTSSQIKHDQQHARSQAGTFTSSMLLLIRFAPQVDKAETVGCAQQLLKSQSSRYALCLQPDISLCIRGA